MYPTETLADVVGEIETRQRYIAISPSDVFDSAFKFSADDSIIRNCAVARIAIQFAVEPAINVLVISTFVFKSALAKEPLSSLRSEMISSKSCILGSRSEK